jgi:hypothetical protein
MSVRPVTGEPRHPALIEHTKERRASLQNRVADKIRQAEGRQNEQLHLHL